MFDTVAASTEEMTGAAGITAGLADILRYIFEINGFPGIASVLTCFPVTARGVMTYQAVDIFFSGKIKAFVYPTIANMACRAVGIIGLWRNAEVIQDIPLAEPLLVIGIKELPGPVLGFMNLFGGFCMAFDTGTGYFGTGLEIHLQFLELGVVSRRYCIGCSSYNCEDQNHPAYNEKNPINPLNAR